MSASAPALRARGTPSQARHYCWAESAALDRAERLGSPYHIAVYLALCRMSAANGNRPDITATVATICHLACCKYRKTFDVLVDLETANLIAISRSETRHSNRQQPNTYTLLRIGQIRVSNKSRLHAVQPESGFQTACEDTDSVQRVNTITKNNKGGGDEPARQPRDSAGGGLSTADKKRTVENEW